MKQRITVTVDDKLLATLDGLVANGTFDSRSAAMEASIQRLVNASIDAEYERALADLDPAKEKALAEEGMDDWSELAMAHEW